MRKYDFIEDFNLDHLQRGDKKKLINLIKKYEDVFHHKDEEILGYTDAVEHQIITDEIRLQSLRSLVEFHLVKEKN